MPQPKNALGVGGILAAPAALFSLRAVSFLFQIAVFRLFEAKHIGVETISFGTLHAVTTFLTKEAFRRAAMRRGAEVLTGSHRAVERADVLQSVYNVSWMGSAFGIAVAALTCVVWGYFPPKDAEVEHFSVGAVLVAAGSCLELLAEPFLLACLLDSHFTYRSFAEGFANLCRSSTVAALRLVGPRLGVIVFGAGHLAHGSVLLVLLFLGAREKGWRPFRWLQRPQASESGFSPLALPEEVGMLRTFAALGVQKFALAEAEKFILLGAFAAEDWGVFGLVTSLGSIACRLVFAPIEERAAVEFAKDQHPLHLEASLTRLMVLQGSVGMAGALVGPLLAPLAIKMLYGSMWSASVAPLLLSWFCVLLGAMAMNGILEAFLASRATPLWVGRWQKFNFFAFACQIALIAALRQQHGVVSVVLGNILCMVLRGCFALSFVRCCGIAKRPAALFAFGLVLLVGVGSALAVTH